MGCLSCVIAASFSWNGLQVGEDDYWLSENLTDHRRSLEAEIQSIVFSPDIGAVALLCTWIRLSGPSC